MSSNRTSRDVIADSVTTDQLTVRRAVIKHNLRVESTNIDTLTAQTINSSLLNLPAPSMFILDDNQVFGPDSGATFSFTRTGNMVVAQLDYDIMGVVVNSNFMQFQIPPLYSPGTNNTNIAPIAICVNGNGVFYGSFIASSGVLQIAPELGSVFMQDDSVRVFPGTITHIVI